MPIPRICLLTLGVADLARSRAFYEALGWKPAYPDCDKIVFFQVGELAVALYPREELLQDCGMTGARPAPGGITLAHNVAERAMVDALMAEAVAAGGTVLDAPRDKPWGYTGYFADPDGHPWEVAHVPSLKLDEAGRIVLG